MSTYQLLQDHSVGGRILVAGSIQSTADVGGLLPTNWVPTPAVDPLDASALAAFYAAGPQVPSLITGQFLQNPFVPRPVTYWYRTFNNPFSSEFSSEFGSSGTAWILSGLGSGLAPISKDL